MPTADRSIFRKKDIEHAKQERLRPGIDRPIILKQDVPKWEQFVLLVWLLLLGALAGFIFVRTYAGGYFVGLQNSVVKPVYDALVKPDWVRHLFVRDEGEKGEAFITIAVIKYYFAKKRWPPKMPNKWDRFERRLGVANERLDDQGFHVLLLAPFWALIYMSPGFAIWGAFLRVTGQHALQPTWWQILIGGLIGSQFMGNRVAKGFAYHLQRFIIRERLSHGQKKPAWWMIWTLQRRFEWEVTNSDSRTRAAANLLELSQTPLRKALRGAAMTLVIVVVLVLTYIGWYVMKYHEFDYAAPFQHVNFHISDLWNHVFS